MNNNTVKRLVFTVEAYLLQSGLFLFIGYQKPKQKTEM